MTMHRALEPQIEQFIHDNPQGVMTSFRRNGMPQLSIVTVYPRDGGRQRGDGVGRHAAAPYFASASRMRASAVPYTWSGRSSMATRLSSFVIRS